MGAEMWKWEERREFIEWINVYQQETSTDVKTIWKMKSGRMQQYGCVSWEDDKAVNDWEVMHINAVKYEWMKQEGEQLQR